MAPNKHNRKYTTLTTPFGLTGFANTNSPSKFGGYSIDLFFKEGDETDALFNEIESISTANFTHETEQNNAKGNNVGYGTHDIKEGDPDQFQGGGYRKLKLKSAGAPKFYDAKGQLIALSHEIPVGSTVRVNINAASYTFGNKVGTTLYMNSIQIADMPERKTKTKTDKPAFGAVDGGTFIGAGSDMDLSLE